MTKAIVINAASKLHLRIRGIRTIRLWIIHFHVIFILVSLQYTVDRVLKSHVVYVFVIWSCLQKQSEKLQLLEVIAISRLGGLF